MRKVPVWLAAVLAVGLKTPCPALAAPSGVSCWQSPKPEPQGGELEKLRVALLQPGAEGREIREKAVDTLLLMTEARAHAVVQDALARGDDPNGLTRFILDSLARKLAQKRDPLFGDTPLRGMLLDSYVPALVRAFAREAEPRSPQSAGPVGERALACLRALTQQERLVTFGRMLAGADVELARAAALAAGGCEDINLASLLAAKLEDPNLGEAARAGLAALTFAPTELKTRADFEAWQADNQGKTYKQLAVEAAVRGKAAVDAVRRRSNELLIRQTCKLVRAMAGADQVDWAALREEVLSPEPVGGTVAYLEALREVLVGRRVLGGVTQDRLAFAQTLQDRIAKGSDPGERAVLLENLAYLQVREVAEQQAAVEALLRDGLGHAAVEVRRAALRGLARYPSAANRAAVLTAATAALAAGDADSLREALNCLQGRGWYAPSRDDQDLASWLILLEHVFAADVPAALKELATKVAIQQDKNQETVDEAFRLLIGLAQDRAQPVALRKQTLIRLGALTGSEERADEYVSKLLVLLADIDAEVRKQAAEQLKSLPEASKTKRRDWQERIVPRAADRLLLEPERKVLRAIVDCLLHVAEDPAHRSAVIGRFNKEVATLAENPPPPQEAFRQQILVDGLRILGSSQVPDLGQWVAAGRALVKLRERDALRNILARQQVKTLAGRDVAGVQGAMQLVIEAALLKPDNVGWKTLPDEVQEVDVAFAELARLKAPMDTPATRSLRVQTLAALDRHAEVVELGRQYLGSSDKALTGEQQVAVTLTVAQSMLRLDQLAEARALLDTLGALGANPAQATGLWLELAERHLRRQEAAVAAGILPGLLQRMPQDAPEYRRCFLLEAEARFAVDPAGSRDAVLADLERKAGLFRGEEVPKPLLERFEALRRKVAEFQG